ncbi:MAG: hypothetical protein MJ236_04750 [Clostridia bacterium]|nr:hypothetical protein [Clostridia bacterium]
MPEVDEEVLVQTKSGIGITFYDNYGSYFNDYANDEIIAWAHLPTGLKPKENEQ